MNEGAKIRVKEIFSSIQGEGFHVGTPSVFIRVVGCNLSCSFCDTDYFEPPYPSGGSLLPDEILASVEEISKGKGFRHIVLTGGEPTGRGLLPLVQLLREANWYVQVETNGTNEDPLLEEADWVTVSPKTKTPVVGGDELKLLHPGPSLPDEYLQGFKHRFLQPLYGDTVYRYEAISRCHSEGWRLSIQIHKMIDLP